jgi:teichuronic acid biosynthesis glycosyltransferase TuaC
MKILFVSSGTSKEGISPLVYKQGESLREQGVDIHYFKISGKGFLGYFRHIFKLKRHLSKNSYDLIHAHYGLSGLVAVFAKQKKQKMVISFMGTDLLGNRNRKGRTTITGNLLVRVNQRLAKHADFVIVKSKQMAHRINCRNKSVISNGVDLSEFYQVFFMADPTRPEKNFPLVRDAFRKLMSQGIELHVFENISASDVIYYYNASDVCVLTSFHEGSPNVIKEAMACNCPIVSTGVGDVTDIFGNTEGCNISSFDHNDLTLKIKETITFSLGKGKTNGRNRIIDLGLDSGTVAKKIIKVYEQVLQN